MSVTIVDARGLSCPQPVMLVKKVITDGTFPIEVSVDTATARENVRRMAEYQGCKVEITQQGDEFKLVITK
jgi:tRNA 2-thiouridine synthesizing protein A